MPATGFTGSQAGNYAKKHNPAAYYTKLAGAYAQNAVPLGTPTAGALISDLRANRLPRYSFITPDLCNDEHDCSISVGDAWLARWVPKILASRAYRAGGTALFITYDEGSDSDNRVYTVVASPTTRKGTVSHAALHALLAPEDAGEPPRSPLPRPRLRCRDGLDANRLRPLSRRWRVMWGATSTGTPTRRLTDSSRGHRLRHHPWPLRRPG